MIKPHEPFMMMIHFRKHQGITKGDTIQENIGGRLVHYKVISIQSIRTMDDGRQEVHMKVRELPGGETL